MPSGSETDDGCPPERMPTRRCPPEPDGCPAEPDGMLRDELAGERTRLSNERTRMANERTRMANERTVLAYLRSAIMLAASGATLIQLYPMRADIKATGVVLIVAGIGLLVFGGVRFRRLARMLGPSPARDHAKRSKRDIASLTLHRTSAMNPFPSWRNDRPRPTADPIIESHGAQPCVHHPPPRSRDSTAGSSCGTASF